MRDDDQVQLKEHRSRTSKFEQKLSSTFAAALL